MMNMSKIKFQDHPILKENDYIKNIYISMLFQFVQSCEEENDERNEYLKKICFVCGYDYSSAESLGYESFEKLLDAFKYDFIGNKVIYTLICDLLILAFCEENPEDEELNLIGFIAETADMDERIFEYMYRVSQAICEDNDTSYLIAVLSRHKEVDFSLFRFYFANDKENIALKEYIEKILLARKDLERLQKKLDSTDIQDIHDLTSKLSSEFETEFTESVERLEELCEDIESETSCYMTISEDDVYWELIEILHDVNHSLDVMFIGAAQLIFVENGFASLSDIDRNLDYKKEYQELRMHMKEAFEYLDELKNF